MKGIVELYNSYVFKSYITLQCISFGTFHLAVMVIIFKLFWVVFLGIPPQMSSSLYKSFTSDQLNQAKINEFLALRTFRFTLSWRYITAVSFISIAFVIVKLTFLESFWPLTLTISSSIAKILTRGSTLAKITLFEKFFEGFLSIYGKWTGPILTPLFLLKMAKIEKNKQYCGKTSAVKLSKVFIFSLLFGKNTISCCNIWDVFTYTISSTRFVANFL